MFSFNGQQDIDMGIFCLPYSRVFHPAERVIQTAIAGKSGTYDYTDNTYDNGMITVSCVYIGSRTETDLRTTAAWLTGDGQLVFDSEPDKAYRASVIQGFDASIDCFEDTFDIAFTVFPLVESIETNLVQQGSVILPYQHNIQTVGTAETPCVIRIHAVTDVTDLSILRVNLS